MIIISSDNVVYFHREGFVINASSVQLRVTIYCIRRHIHVINTTEKDGDRSEREVVQLYASLGVDLLT